MTKCLTVLFVTLKLYSQDRMDAVLTPQQFVPPDRNIADGMSHPLSGFFGPTNDANCKTAHARFSFVPATVSDGCDLAAEFAWAALTEALTAKVSASWYGRMPYNTVYVPAGAYLLNRTIVLSNGDGGSLDGNGPSRTMFYWSGDAVSPLFRLESCRHMAFSNFTVQVSGGAEYLKYVFFTGELTGLPGVKSINSSNTLRQIVVTTPDSTRPTVGWFVYNAVGSFWGRSYSTKNGEGYLLENCAATGLAEDGFYSDAYDTASTTFINTRFWGVKAGVRANAGYNFCCGSDISGATEAAFVQGPNVNAPITIAGVNVEDSYALFKNARIQAGMTSQAQPVVIDNVRYTWSDWMGYAGTVTADGGNTVTLASGTAFMGSKAVGWLTGKPININGATYTVQGVLDAKHVKVDRPVPSSAGLEYSFSVPGIDPNGVIQIAQHGPVTVRNSTIGVDNRWPLRVWWNNNTGYGHTPSLFRIENVVFHSKGPKFAHSRNLAGADALFIGAWPDTVNSWMMTGDEDSGVATNVSMSTQPIWIKHRVTKVAGGAGDCVNANGCWQIDEGAIPPSNIAAGAGDSGIVLTSLPGGSYISDVTLKTVRSCTGANPIIAGLGNNTDSRYYTDTVRYDLGRAAGDLNQLNVQLTNRGSSRMTVGPSAANAVQENFIVFVRPISGNVEAVADGCSFDVYMLVGRRPMEMPTGH